MRTLIVIASGAILIAASATAAAHTASTHAQSGGVGGSITWTPNTPPPLPDQADWRRIQDAAGLRHLALEKHRTAHFRSFSAALGLSELNVIRPLGPGRCQTSVKFLYDNLLDLENASPGENWNPLRRLVAKGPSIRACAPR